MGAAEDAVRRQLDATKRELQDKLDRIAAEEVERVLLALPDALENLARLGYPPDITYGDNLMIEWEGEERYAWCLYRVYEGDHEVYMFADGTFLLRSASTGTSFDVVSPEEAARLGVRRELERIATFKGGPSGGVPTLRDIFFPRKKRKWLSQ